MTRRIVGAVLVLLGVLGIVLSVLGVIAIWRAAEDVATAADDSLVLVSDTLEDISRSLDVASTTLNGAGMAMDGLYTTTLDVSSTLTTTRVTVEEMAGLTEDDLPRSIDATLVALEALEDTSGVIDRLLRGLRRVGVGDYDPEIPLDQAVAEAGEGLAPASESLRAMGAGLREMNESLEDVQVGIVLMGDHMIEIGDNLDDADAALSSHGSTLKELQTRVRRLRRTAERPIRTVAWGTTLLLVWIGLSQLAIVRWGVGLWRDGADTGVG